MIEIKQAVIVEGKYDKIKLSSIINAVIIPTHGFSIFKDKEKCELIRYYAKNKGIIILTDSDSAGFKIRGYIKNIAKDGNIVNVYIPDIYGKEKRKLKPSKEGKLGVEGIDKNILIDAFQKAGVLFYEKEKNTDIVTNLDLFEDGLAGRKNSSEKRKALLNYLDMPELLTTSAMLEVINTMYSKKQYKQILKELNI